MQPNSEFIPSFPSGGGPIPPPPDLSTGYDRWSRRPIAYLPVMVGGELVGCLWASVEGHAAGYLRRIAADSDNITRPSYWNEQLDRLADRGMTALDAIRSWIGAPADAHMGRIPADAEEGRATNKAELWELLNPGGPPLGEGPWVQDGEYPSGSPEDRASGWSAPTVVNPPRYATETTGPIIFYPVAKNSRTVGYLWASPTDSAADYVPRLSAGPDGQMAGGLWVARLMDCYAARLSALEAIRWCRGQPYDEYSGAIPPGAQEEHLESLSSLRIRAQQQ